MEQFTQEFIAFRDRMEAQLPAEFTERERGVLIAGRGCALAAGYSLTQERKVFGLVGFGNHTHSHEERLLYSAPGLDAGQVAGWRAYAQEALRERIKLDSGHEFSIFSVILATDGAEKAVIRALKKADCEERYTAPGAGWSQIRFLLADLSSKRLYPSPMGKPLVNILREAL